MRRRASAAKSPSILPSAMTPPPTTTTSRSRSFTKIGSRPISALDPQWRRAGSRVALHRSNEFPGQPSANLLVRVPRKKATQILAGRALLVEFAEQALDGIRDPGSRAAITDRSRDRRKFPDPASNAKVIRIHHASIHFQLLALNPN